MLSLGNPTLDSRGVFKVKLVQQNPGPNPSLSQHFCWVSHLAQATLYPDCIILRLYLTCLSPTQPPKEKSHTTEGIKMH